MRKMNVAEAKARLSDLIAAALDGEEVVIARRDKPVVRLVPVVESRQRVPQLGRLAGRGWISPDFDAPIEDMAPYSEPARPARRRAAKPKTPR